MITISDYAEPDGYTAYPATRSLFGEEMATVKHGLSGPYEATHVESAGEGPKHAAVPACTPQVGMDHQLPVGDDQLEFLPGEDPDTLARLKREGFVVEVGRGGKSGTFKG